MSDEAASKQEPTYSKLAPSLPIGLIFAQRKHSIDYFAWKRITEIFPIHFPGVITSRDTLVVDIDREILEKRMRRYFDPYVPFDDLATEYPSLIAPGGASYNPRTVRTELIERTFRPWQVIRYCYRPFDLRWVYWEPNTDLLDRKREPYVAQLIDSSLWVEARQKEPTERFCRGTVTCRLADNFGRGPSSFFPQYHLAEMGDLYGNLVEQSLNLSLDALRYVSEAKCRPENLFPHLLAVMHSTAYREENSGALLGDWPRVPLPLDGEMIQSSAELGRRVVILLDPDSNPKFDREWKPIGEWKTAKTPPNLEQDLKITVGWGGRGQGSTVMPGRGKCDIRPWTDSELAALTALASTFNVSEEEVLPLLGDKCVDVWLNGGAWWSGVPEQVWEYTLGGYQVLKKWLSYREFKLLERPLKKEEARYFTEVVRRITSILLMGPALDANYRRVAASALTPGTPFKAFSA